MKITIAVLFLTIAICGCSENQVSSTTPAIDRVQAGADVKWTGSIVLHVDKRDGMAVEGVKLTAPENTCTADSGTLSAGSPRNSSDSHCVTIVLTNARTVISTDLGAIYKTNDTLQVFLRDN